MEIILLEKVQNLGDLGDLVNVKPGYARNYLIPQGKATAATAANKDAFEQRRKELEQTANQKLEQAKQRHGQLNEMRVEIMRKSSEEGRLFGSVSPSDIADAVDAAGVELAKSEVVLSDGPLKELGDHEVAIALHPEVTSHIVVAVVPEV